MSYAERHVVSVTTSTGGAATAYTPVVTGRVSAIKYVKATAALALASTADFTITGESSGFAILSKSNVNADFLASPSQPVHTATGAVVAGVVHPVVIAKERVKIAVASGGSEKQGTFQIFVD